jgi:hypothetical protein
VIDVFVDELDMPALAFEGVAPETTGRPVYHPATMLKIYGYGYISQIQSSRRLERETGRNVGLGPSAGHVAAVRFLPVVHGEENGRAGFPIGAVVSNVRLLSRA